MNRSPSWDSQCKMLLANNAAPRADDTAMKAKARFGRTGPPSTFVGIRASSRESLRTKTSPGVFSALNILALERLWGRRQSVATGQAPCNILFQERGSEAQQSAQPHPPHVTKVAERWGVVAAATVLQTKELHSALEGESDRIYVIHESPIRG